jgi:hypothetical protein
VDECRVVRRERNEFASTPPALLVGAAAEVAVGVLPRPETGGFVVFAEGRVRDRFRVQLGSKAESQLFILCLTSDSLVGLISDPDISCPLNECLVVKRERIEVASTPPVSLRRLALHCLRPALEVAALVGEGVRGEAKSGDVTGIVRDGGNWDSMTLGMGRAVGGVVAGCGDLAGLGDVGMYSE